ncbi:MAG: two-component system response regulator CreB [Thiogranum sp.]
MHSILIIEDEPAITDAVTYALETEGFETRCYQLGQEGLDALCSGESFALVILDVGLPDISGFEVCKSIRRFSNVPIIFLTARNEEVDRVVGLEIGGDDYVSKPFSPRELAARVKVILKRTSLSESNNKVGSEFEVDVVKAQIRYYGERLELTRYEYLILSLLLKQPERVFTRTQIMDNVWEEPETSLERAVDTHIKSLRTKLRAVTGDADPIRTHRGMGYSIKASTQ